MSEQTGETRAYVYCDRGSFPREESTPNISPRLHDKKFAELGTRSRTNAIVGGYRASRLEVSEDGGHVVEQEEGRSPRRLSTCATLMRSVARQVATGMSRDLERGCVGPSNQEGEIAHRPSRDRKQSLYAGIDDTDSRWPAPLESNVHRGTAA